MAKTFNTYGYCDPGLNYMVDLKDRLDQIKNLLKKQIGVKEIKLGDKILIEATV